MGCLGYLCRRANCIRCVYREEGQLYVCVGKVGSDDTVETYSTNVVNDDCLEAVESELEKLLKQFC